MCEKQKYGYCRWQFKNFELRNINFNNNTYNIPKNTDLFIEQSLNYKLEDNEKVINNNNNNKNIENIIKQKRKNNSKNK